MYTCVRFAIVRQSSAASHQQQTLDGVEVVSFQLVEPPKVVSEGEDWMQAWNQIWNY